MNQQGEINLYNEAFQIAFKDRFDTTNVDVFESVGRILPKDAVKIIEQFQPHHGKGIVLVGDNEALAKGIVSYLWYTHPHRIKRQCGLIESDKLKNKIGVRYSQRFHALWKDVEMRPLVGRDCLGFNENDIDRLLSERPSLLDCYIDGDVVFLSNLKNQYLSTSRLLDRLSLATRGNPCGILTVNLHEMPEGNLGRFDVIPLPGSKSQGKAEPVQQKKSWTDLIIMVLDSETVKISHCGTTGIPLKFNELGFKDKRSGKPVKSWYTLLAFAEKEILSFPHNNKEKMEKLIQDLRKRLKDYFGIPEDPISYDNGYKCTFKIQKYEDQGRSVYAFANNNVDDIEET